MNKKLLILLAASVLTLGSCTKKNNNSQNNGSVSSVSLSQETMEVQLGKRSSDIKVTLAGEGDFEKGIKIVSENDKIAQASFTEINDGETFKVYGIAAGETKINVLSKADETKAASLSVSVKTKEQVPEAVEILSVSLDKDTHLFHESDEPLAVTVTVNGRGQYDSSALVALSENSCVSVDKTEVASGGSFLVTPTSLSNGETTTIKVSSKQDEAKYAELIVRVDEDIDPIVPGSDLSLNASARALQEGGASFTVFATTSAAEVEWSWKENDATEYVAFDGTPGAKEATVKPVKATPTDKYATLVATVGESKAECRFSVAEKAKEFRTFYVSNNSYLGYEHVYLYAWGDGDVKNAEFPGVELTTKIQNTLGEDCYEFSVDVLLYTGFKFSDGTNEGTVDALFADFGPNNNVWYDGEGAHFTQIAKDVPNVSFYTNSVSIYTGEAATTFGFDVRKGVAEYDVVSGPSKIQVTDFTNGSISIKGLEVGNATIRVFIPDPDPEVTEPLAEDYLYIEILDDSLVKAFYFTNNKGWSQVCYYAWKEGGDAMNWPGVELTNPIKNSGGEDVYVVHIPTKYDHFIINNNNNGEQTVDVELADTRFATNDNIYCDGTLSAEGKYDVGFANFEPFAYSVAFESATATVYAGHNTKVRVTANGTGVNYNVTEGADNVQLFNTTDSHIILKWLKAGSAKVVATLHDASAELLVTCSNEEAPATSDVLYFTNNENWANVYLYTWGNGTSNEWPGVKLENPLKNTSLQDVYVLDIDEGIYDYFIINNGSGTQTVDISLDNPGFASYNNIFLNGQEDGKYTIGFANFEEHVHSYDPTTHQCACGEYDPDADIDTVDVEFVVNYETSPGQDLFIAGIKGWDEANYVAMSWSEGHNWRATVTLAVGVEVQFKFRLRQGGAFADGEGWESAGANRTYTPTVSKTETLTWGIY